MSFQVFQPYIDTLFAPDDVTALALIDANNSGNVQHTFMLASQLRTEATYKALVKLNEQFNVYVAMNPFKPELIGQKMGRTKENVAAVKRVYADADKDGAAIVEKIMAGGDVPEPTVVLESSPGKFQCIWNVDGLDRETADSVVTSSPVARARHESMTIRAERRTDRRAGAVINRASRRWPPWL